MANRISGWIDSREACQKGWDFNLLLLSGKSLFSCNWYRVQGQSAHPLQRAELVRAGTRDFQSPLHRAGISGLVAFIFLPCHRVSKTSRSFEKCLMMCRTNTLGSERRWRRLFVKQNQSDSAGFSQSLHTSMQTEDSWETLIPVPCYSRSHTLSEAPHEKLWALPLLFILELDASTSLLEDERLYLTSNLNFFMISSYSFVLMPVLAFSLNGFLFLDVLLTFVICYH